MKTTSALVFLLSLIGAVDGWVPSSASSSTSRHSVSVKATTGSSQQEEEDHEIAAAWRQVDADMTQNDQEALRLWKQIGDSFRALAAGAASTSTSTSTDKPLLQAHDLYDEAAAQLVAQLATMEATELADRQAWIEQAKADSEGILMQAKWDQQKASTRSPKPIPSVRIPQAHDLVDDQADQLIQELAALDAQQLNFKQTLIEHAHQLSEGITMNNKIDQQQEQPIVPESKQPMKPGMPTDPEAANLVAELAAMDAQALNSKQTLIQNAHQVSEGITMNNKLDQQQELPITPPPLQVTTPGMPTDPEAVKLIQELAALDAQQLNFKNTLIQHAHQLSEGITMNNKIDQQLIEATLRQEPKLPQPDTGTANQLLPQLDEQAEAALLVAQLAAIDAAQFAAKESLINNARETSQGVTMKAKIDQQVQIPKPAKPSQAPDPDFPQAHHFADDDAKKLVAELAALDAKQHILKEALVESARATSQRQIIDAKMEQQEQFVRPSKKTNTNASPPPQFDQDVAQLVARLAAKDANDFTNKQARIDHARETSKMITMEAKINQQQTNPMKRKHDIIQPEILQAHDLLDPEAQHLVAQLANKDATDFSAKQSRVNSARDVSEMLTMEAKYDQKEKEAMQPKPNSKPPKTTTGTKTNAKKKSVINEEALRLRRQLAMLQVQQFALQMDIAKSQAVTEDAKEYTHPITRNKRDSDSKRLERESHELEAYEFALQRDMEKSNAVSQDARLDAAYRLAKEVMEPVVLAAEKLTKALAKEDTVVEAEAEPVFLAAQNPNQMLQVIDVEALRSAAQEVQDASVLLSTQLRDSMEKDTFIQEALEAAESVLQQVQFKQSLFSNNPAPAARSTARRPKNLNDPTGPSLADMNNNGMTEKRVQEMKHTERVTKPIMLDPLPQDVTNHQEDAARFFFAKRAAQEISMKEDPYYLKKAVATGKTKPACSKSMSAAELAAMEHDELDQQLRELFADVSLGFKEVKQSLAKLLRGETSNDGFDGMSNSTAWQGYTP